MEHRAVLSSSVYMFLIFTVHVRPPRTRCTPDSDPCSKACAANCRILRCPKRHNHNFALKRFIQLNHCKIENKTKIFSFLPNEPLGKSVLAARNRFRLRTRSRASSTPAPPPIDRESPPLSSASSPAPSPSASLHACDFRASCPNRTTRC